MQQLPWHQFYSLVRRYRGDHKVKSFRCADHYRVMAFAQLTYRESLRDIEACLRAMRPKLFHMGIHSTVSRNNLSNANEKRDWRIYAEFAQVLIDHARRLYADEDFGVDLDATVYALDSTTIDLCLSLFPWAYFRRAKGAVKLHALLDLRGPIPTFIRVTHGLVHDINILDEIIPEPGAYYVMDRAYIDYSRLYILHQSLAYFVTRAKRNSCFRRLYSRPVDKTCGLRCDQTVVLTGIRTSKAYPEKFRRICYYDEELKKRLVFMTNNFLLPAYTITQIFKCRWQIEIFFKWIKQHLRIKSFYGTSPNAVKTQIWTAISVYVLVAIVRKQLKISLDLYTILQILSLTLFEKVPLDQLLMDFDYKLMEPENGNQLLIHGL